MSVCTATTRPAFLSYGAQATKGSARVSAAKQISVNRMGARSSERDLAGRDGADGRVFLRLLLGAEQEVQTARQTGDHGAAADEPRPEGPARLLVHVRQRHVDAA